jgi:hypothetical protein
MVYTTIKLHKEMIDINKVKGQRSKVEGECHVQYKRMWDDGCTTARETRVRNYAVGGLLVAEIT